MLVSLAAKVVGGASVGVAGTASAYYAVQHFTKVTLNSVEKKLFDNNPTITLTVEDAAKEGNKSKVSVKVTAGLDATKESWECTVSSILAADQVNKFEASKDELKKQLTDKLTPAGTTTDSNRKGFIWSCAKNRQSKFSDSKVKSEIFINTEAVENTKFKFGQATLDGLFKFEEATQAQG